MSAKLKKEVFKELYNSFKRVNKKNNKNIFITSNLSKLAKINLKNEIKLQILIRALKKSVGKNFTIFFPSATLNLVGKNKIFDPKLSPSFQMGSLTEFVRLNEKITRTEHPFWSVIAIGKNQKILKNISKHAFGYGSPWTKMIEKNALQINLDIEPWKAISLVHYVETVIGVPYRYNKEFTHKLKINNKTIKKRFYLSSIFKSPKILKKKMRNINFFNILKKKKKINLYKNKYNQKIWSFKMRDFFDTAVEEFNKDIYCCVNKNFYKYKDY